MVYDWIKEKYPEFLSELEEIGIRGSRVYPKEDNFNS
jgi:hypothetical protein